MNLQNTRCNDKNKNKKISLYSEIRTKLKHTLWQDQNYEGMKEKWRVNGRRQKAITPAVCCVPQRRYCVIVYYHIQKGGPEQHEEHNTVYIYWVLNSFLLNSIFVLPALMLPGVVLAMPQTGTKIHLDKNIRSKLCYEMYGPRTVKKFPTFYETRMFIAAFTSTHRMSLTWARSI
jgi:hypothetical protein